MMQPYIEVNLTDMIVKNEKMPEKYDGFGGRGLVAKFLNEEVDPGCDPIGEDNKLIICTGLLAGTPASSSDRLSVGAKSPLTGTVKEANAGGTAGRLMTKLGLKAIVIEGKPKSGWWILHLTPGGANLIQGDEYAGLNTYELFEKLQEKFGKKCGILGIGVAGERLYNIASIQVASIEGHPTRVAARGGLGAVMGSKRIKAVIIEEGGNAELAYDNREKFNTANKILIEGIKSNPLSGGAMPGLGTAVLVNVTNSIGALSTRNFSDGQFDMAENISGEFINELQGKRGIKGRHPCQPGCIIKCSMDYNDENGAFLTSGLEFETLGLLGANLGIGDIDAIARLDRMCDDIGVDTMDAGVILGVCMEGGKAEFGDMDGAFALLKEMADGTDFGKLMGKGANNVGKELGVERIPTVKGQGLAAYDPRALKGTGVTYAVSTMGADHTTGNLIGNPVLDPVKKDGTIPAVTQAQVVMATADSLGVCIFSSFCWADPACFTAVADLLEGLYGGEWDTDKVAGLGVECLTLEKEFNRKAGITEGDDVLPEFFSKEPLNPTNAVFDFTPEELAEAIPF
jgi:aldehyde:ferredoxin oxidoreductase